MFGVNTEPHISEKKIGILRSVLLVKISLVEKLSNEEVLGRAITSRKLQRRIQSRREEKALPRVKNQ